MIKQPINATRFIITTCKTILLICSIGMYSFANAQNKGIHFEHYTNWQGILAKAKAENKYIFVDCFTTWCGPCRAISNIIFPMEEVGNFYNDKFINVKMQFDSTINDAEDIKAMYADAVFISKEYKIKNYPTFLFFSPDGELLHRKAGCNDSKDFITIGINALDSQKQYYTQIKKYDAGQRDSTFLKNLTLMARANFDDSLVEKYAKEYYATQTNLLNNANMLFLYQTTNNVRDTGFYLMMNNLKKFEAIADKSEFHERLKEIIVIEEFKSVGGWVNLGKYDNEQWRIYSNKIKKTYPLFAEDVLLEIKMPVYKTTNNWDEYAATATRYAKTKSALSWKLSRYAWGAFVNCSSKNILNQALHWSKQSFTNQEKIDPNFIDTYANLLYKLGRKNEALEWEQKALKITIEQGGDIAWVQGVIDKINKGEKTW